MIKSIKVRTSKEIIRDSTNILPIDLAIIQKNKIETIALTTSTFEEILLNNHFLISEGFSYNTKGLATKVIHNYDLLLINHTSKLDLIKALKDGDIAAKKRILKQLEEL